jgi:tetratricopeptide (TPR) repeat protein
VSARAGGVDLGALLKETEAAIEKLDNGVEKARLQVSLAIAYAKHGDRQQALHWLNRAVNLAVNVPSCWIEADAELEKIDLLRRALAEQAELGDFEGALRSANAWGYRDKPLAITGEQFGDVAAGRAKAGDAAAAWATCDRIHPRWGRPQALASVAHLLAEAHRFDAALATLDRIDKLPAEDNDARQVNQQYRNQSLLMVVREQARFGPLKDTLRTAERANGNPAKIETLQAIARVLLERGDQSGAREAVARARSIYARLDAAQQKSLWKMAASQAEVGDVAGALETASKHLEGGGRGFALLSISIAQSKAGKPAEAAQTFKQGLALAKSQQFVGWYTLGAAVNEQVEGGEFDRALEIAQFSGRPSLVLQHVAVGLARSGNVRRALEIANSITGVAGDRAEALNEIAAIQAQAKAPLARQTFQWAFEAAIADEDEVVSLKKVGLAQVRAGYVDAAADTFREVRQRVIRLKSEDVKLADIARAQAGGGDPTGALAWARSQSSRRVRAQGLVGVLEGLTDGPE